MLRLVISYFFLTLHWPLYTQLGSRFFLVAPTCRRIQHLGGGGYDTIATTSQLRVSTLVSQRTKVSSCLATSTPMHAWSPSSVRASPAASPRPSWRCVRDPDSPVPEASPTLATRIALPDASAADRGASGGDLGPARFRVSSQIAPRMILAHRRVARIPWMPPRGHHRRRARDLARRFVTLGNRRRIQLA